MVTVKQLQKKLLNIVNNEVDEIKEGEPKRYSETGEDYIQLGCTFKKEDISKLLKMFENAIKGYKECVKINFVGKMKDINNSNKLKVYWRVKPEVDLFNIVEEETLMKAFMIDSSDKYKEFEKEFANTEKKDYGFYTRFLFTYQDKING